MRLIALMAVLAMTVSGCLTTSKAVLTPENSILASESAAFKRFVEAWEESAGTDDSPRAIMEGDQRLADLDGIMIIEEKKTDGSAEYYAVGMLSARPVACFAHDARIKELAASLNVQVDVDRDEGEEGLDPVPIRADGSKQALSEFIRQIFRNGTLVCFAPPKGGIK